MEKLIKIDYAARSKPVKILKDFEPKPNMTYIFQYNTVSIVGRSGNYEIPKGTIVHDVIKVSPNSCRYQFRVEGFTECFISYLPWAFAENTVENRGLIREAEKVWENMSKLKNQRKKLLAQIITLEEKPSPTQPDPEVEE